MLPFLALLLSAAPPAQDEFGLLEVNPVPFEVRTREGRVLDVEAGTVTVPENRRAPETRAIRLAFARLVSSADEPGPPLVYLHGGPGGWATGDLTQPDRMSLWSRFLDLGDVILLDQRGCGRSEPNLSLPVDEPIPADAFLDFSRLEGYLVRTGARVKAELEGQGLDLGGYDTEQNADDVADLLTAFGYEQARLVGFSYGTHLGLSVIRRHGARIEAAVLIGVEGPDETVKLPGAYDTLVRRLAAMVAADPVVGRDVPDLTALLGEVLELLAEEPMLVEVIHPTTGETIDVPVGPEALQYILVRDLGDASDLPVFPRLLWSVREGDPRVLAWFVQKRLGLGRYPTAVFTIDYASGCTPERAARIAVEARTSVLGNAMNAFVLPAVAEVWGTADLGAAFRAPVVSDVRTLFLSGDLDANTPPYQAERARWGFRDSVHLVQRNGGHESWFANGAAHDAMHAFLAGGDVRGRIVDLPPLRFLPVEGPVEAPSHPSVQD